MAVTRAKATALLNKTEMGLYDDSRANALRGHTEARLNQLVTRARTARDRARDLEKRQRLASRGKTGSKSGRSGQANVRTGEKAELLADILKRLETQHRETAKAAKATAKQSKAKPAKPAATKKSVAKKASAKKIVAKKATAKKVAAKKTTLPAASKKADAKPAVAGKAAKKTVAKKAAKTKAAARTTEKPAAARRTAASTKPAARPAKPRRKAPASITPEQALENTRKLLEQHDAEAKSPKPWETLGADGAAPATPGYQSPQARANALALHAAESRQASIQGSISTRDRRNQGKRDHRNSED